MRLSTRLVAFCGALTVVGAGLVVPAAPAFAVPGLQRVEAVSAFNSDSSRTVTATCPSGTRVIGGGGNANDNGVHKVMLTELRPVFGGLDSFRATAVEPVPNGIASSWNLTAYALCAPSPAGIEMRSASTTPTSDIFQVVNVGCSSGKRAVTAGAVINGAAGAVGLHLVRPDGPLTIARANAREVIFTGFTWSLTTYVVCVSGFANQHSEAVVSNGPQAVMGCTSGMIHSVGGGGAVFDDGPYFLQSVIPVLGLSAASVSMTAAAPNGNGIVVQSTCAT
jgi:hypothetical protein